MLILKLRSCIHTPYINSYRVRVKCYSTSSRTSKLLHMTTTATHQDLCSYSWSGSILIVSRTYISPHASNSIACTLQTGLEVQPRLEVCWALAIRTARHSSRQLPANTIRAMRSFVKRKTPLPSFTNMGFRLKDY